MATPADKPKSAKKKLGFSDPPVASQLSYSKTYTEEELQQHHEAKEEFESKRGQNICSAVFGIIFFVAACVLFWVASDSGLTDIYILAAVVLVIGLILAFMAVINSYRSFNRMKSANNRVEHQDILSKTTKPQLRQRSADSFATQSDISIRGFSPLPAEVKRPKTADLYSKAAIKPADIEQYNKASSEALEERTKSRQDPEEGSGLFQRTGTLIRLGSSLSKKSPHDGGDDDDVVIIHDAKVALPNPVLHESIDSSQNASNNNTKVVFTLETRKANEIPVPVQNPDVLDDYVGIPGEFNYEVPNSSNL